ncbi:MAG: glycoside hydrolase family 32 protein [Microbacteriaceae bacterium]|nr:glycoside hydrolase family 32 protein [Microbacteriaceae bacterium]
MTEPIPGSVVPDTALRPSLHLMPAKNWMNDPNGPILVDGVYHLFFQHNPDAAVWSRPAWGHASSTDLVHWTHHPNAIEPAAGTPDEDGCFSGSVVLSDDGPVMIYTGVRGQGSGRIETTCLAFGDPSLQTWTRYPGNPVLVPGEGVGADGFRDPFVWRERDGSWHQLVGAGDADEGGSILHYRSSDLREWEFASVLYGQSSDDWPGLRTGHVWECPQLLSFGDEFFLIVSIYRNAGTVWFGGGFDGQVLTPTRAAPFDWGDLFAPAILRDGDRWIAFGWCMEDPVHVEDGRSWSGAMSLPRELVRAPGGMLGQRFAAEVSALRAEPLIDGRRTIDEQTPLLIPGDGSAIEVSLSVPADALSHFWLEVASAPTANQGAAIFYDAARGQLVIDRARVGDLAPLRADLNIEGGWLRLHVIVDASVIELIANETCAITSRLYPTDPVGTAVVIGGSKPIEVDISAWRLNQENVNSGVGY